MITSPHTSGRGSSPVRLVVIHTAEGSRTVESLGNFFARPGTRASSHIGIDDKRTEMYVPYTRAAWTLRSGNGVSDNAELCGFAAWTRTVWLTEHRHMLELAAQWIRERCLARGIPLVKLTPAQVRAGEAGVCGHYDWTVGMKDGTHTDPGPGFPWDVVMTLAGKPTTTTGGLFMSLTPTEEREILEGIRKLKPGVALPARSPNCRRRSDDQFGHTLNGEAEAADGRVAAETALAEVRALTAALKAKGVL